MDEEAVAKDLASARAEIDRIDREMSDLAHRRELVEAFIESGEKLLAAMRPGTSLAPVETGWTPRQVTGNPGANRRRPGPNAPLAERRRFWKSVFHETLDILRREGRALTATEIHRLHGLRDEVTPEEVYDTLYKRSSRGNYIHSIAGRFALM